MEYDALLKNLKGRGFLPQLLPDAAAARDAALAIIGSRSVGFGGSATVRDIGLYETLAAQNNTLYWHWHAPTEDRIAVERAAQAAEVFVSSSNAVLTDGRIVNIDGTGNRVSSSLYGHKRVWFVVGSNKIAPTYDEALWRARNIAAPKNAQRLHAKTPCAVKADHCYDCKSPGRICRALTVLWGAMMGSDMEVVLVNEDLGY